MNPTQKVPTFKAGQALTADSLNHAVRALLGMIVPGRGILVKPMGNKIEISAEGQGIPRGGGGWSPQEYATEDDLPTGDRLPTDMAVLTDGDLAGSWWVPSPGLTGWRPLNVWRAP